MPNISTNDAQPIVSVVMAAYNVGDYIDEALSSVRRQSLDQIEIIVVDDGSTDTTAEILARHAQEDRRITSVAGSGAGPAGARNLAIARARGQWIAIVDADDLIDCHRLARLVEAGDRHNADAVADNMIAFYDPKTAAEHVWIDPAIWPTERLITFRDMMDGGGGEPPAPELGYLKPILRKDRLALLDQHYRDDLVIGEDFDLMARWTAAGFSYLYAPDAGYRYRRRASSLSYRLSTEQIDQMISALDGLDRAAPSFNPDAVNARKTRLQCVRRYTNRVGRLKQYDFSALAPLIIDADCRIRLKESLREGLKRRIATARVNPSTHFSASR